ncbi:MAG: DegT/DnrJ/EryC1/StrS family aminotransferase [Phycisphaeraceae bacterium]|nr:DegT/DnrJ/EryC1/StrS family aminotransferase [Phycisphaeraceae bacterium]
MTTATTTDLAIFGGPKTVTLSAPPWPCFTDAEIQFVADSMTKAAGDWRLACTAAPGGLAEDLEKKFCQVLGRKYAIATAGGGPALHIACLAAGIQLGDEVITSPYSWGQTCSCILQAGGIPIFADIDPDTLTIDPRKIEPLITPRTRAIVLVHIFGIPADLDPIMAIARKHNLIVIEDCAQAQGSLYKGKQVGSFGHFACFSIGSGKNLAAGDGGMLVVDDDRLHQMALLAGMHPARTGPQVTIPELRSKIDSLIYTYRINAFTAALALKQFERLDEMNSWRRKNAAHLRQALTGVPGIKPMPIPADRDPAWHIIPWSFVPEDFQGKVNRVQYLKALQAEGVPIGWSYVGNPINLRHIFQTKDWWSGHGYPWKANPRGDQIVYRKGDCPVAEKRCWELDLTLGGGPWMKDLRPFLEQIAEAFRKVTAAPQRLAEIKV